MRINVLTSLPLSLFLTLILTGVLDPTSNYKHTVIDLHNCDGFAEHQFTRGSRLSRCYPSRSLLFTRFSLSCAISLRLWAYFHVVCDFLWLELSASVFHQHFCNMLLCFSLSYCRRCSSTSWLYYYTMCWTLLCIALTCTSSLISAHHRSFYSAYLFQFIYLL